MKLAITLLSMAAMLAAQGQAPKAAPASRQPSPEQVTEGAARDRGTFHILSNGREIGTESFEIGPASDGVRATAVLQISVEGTGRMSETATLLLRRGNEPATYERLQKSPKRASATVSFGPTKANAQYKMPEEGTRDMEFVVPKNVVVLDTNFFHHYTFLVGQYDFLKGGAQQFQVLIPQEASPGVVRLEFIGADQSWRKLVARTDELEIEIWADDSGRVMKLAVPAAKVEVVRK